MHIPRVTIVTPSFNQGRYLEETVCSILDQKYPNLEYFIVDGGSTDNSINIIKKYEKYIDFWVSEKDGGQSSAINKGFSRATGDFVSWINSDDMLEPGILSKISTYFEKNDVGLIFGKSISFGDGVAEKTSACDFDELCAKTLACVAFPQPASFFRRKVLEEQGFLDESLHFGMDYDFFVRIALNYEIRPVNEIVSRNRYHPESKSISNTFNFALDWAKVFSRLLRSFEFTAELISDLKDLQIYHDGNDRYEVGLNFQRSDIERAHIYFLQEQAQLYYGAYKMPEARRIVKRIKALDSDLYDRYQLDEIYIRSTYIPVFMIKLLKLLRSKLSGRQQGGW